jgi:hypothetical protein
MIRSLIAIAALMASVSVSAGELDGKAIICKSETSLPQGIEFFDGKAMVWFIVSGTKVNLANQDASEYRTTPTRVTWSKVGSDLGYEIDRKTLAYSHMNFRSGTTYWTTSCEVAKSRTAMMGYLEGAVRVEQGKIDEQMKDNKI